MKVVGCASKRRVRMVDLPAPEGPEMTIGRAAAGMAIVRFVEKRRWGCVAAWRSAGSGIVRGTVLRVDARDRAVEAESRVGHGKCGFMEQVGDWCCRCWAVSRLVG